MLRALMIALTASACSGGAPPPATPSPAPVPEVATEATWEGKSAPCDDMVVHQANLLKRELRRQRKPATDVEARQIDLEIDQETPHAFRKCEQMPWPGPDRACVIAASTYEGIGECARLTWPAAYNQELMGRCAEKSIGHPAAERACIDRMLCGQKHDTRQGVESCWRS
jgi:hypothetical protein